MRHTRNRRRLLPAVVLATLAGAAPGAASAATPSAAGGGGPAVVVEGAGSPALSFTGRYLAYEVRADTPAGLRTQVLRKDLVTGAVRVLNRGTNGTVADRANYSLPPLISADGRSVAFTSSASTLVAGDTNGRFDAFVRDVPGQSTALVSRALGGGFSTADTGMVALAAGGRYAAFTSGGTDLVAGSTTTNTDVFRRDLVTGSTEQVTVRADGSPSRGGGSNAASLSADGSLVAFISLNTDLVGVDGNDGENDLFVRDMASGVTRWLSAGLPAGADPSGPVMSGNGRWISTRWADGTLHLTRVATGVTTAVAGGSVAQSGAFSNTGVFGYVGTDGKAYVRDLATGATTELGTPSGGSAGTVAVAGDGRSAAFDWTSDDGTVTRILRVTL